MQNNLLINIYKFLIFFCKILLCSERFYNIIIDEMISHRITKERMLNL